MPTVVHDLRGALRALLRHRAYTAASIATLALGIGATTAIFTVVNTVVLRPLPFALPHRLIQLYATPAERGEAIALADVEAYRTKSATVEVIAGYGVSARYLRGSGEPARVMTVLAERALFDVLGVRPVAGRTFRPDDAADVAVISHQFSIERLGGAESAIGRTVMLDHEPITVIGVMPATFQFPYSSATTLRGVASETRTDMWLPMYRLGQPLRGRASVVARLRPDVSLEEARSELALIAARQASSGTPEARGRGVRVERLRDAVVPPTIRRPLFFLLAAVAIVLALACANVTNLSLAHATLRSREVAVRAALGASPLRIARQFLTESLVLSLTGGLIGLWLARIGADRLVTLAAPHVPRAREAAIDWSVFLFLLGVSTLTGAVFGMVPALIARSIDPQAVLQESGSHGTAGARQRRLRDGLVVVEVALAFVLAVAGAVLVRELMRLRSVEPGLTTGNVVTLHLGHRMTPRTDPRQFYEIADRVAQLPGVSAAGLTQMLPLQNWGWQSTSGDFRVNGLAPPADFSIELRYVTPGYFDAIGMVVMSGRGFTATDTRDTAPVIVINETLARRYFDGGNAVGQATSRGVIVGVVRDVRQVHLDRPAQPEIYFPVAQNWSQVGELGMTLVVRTFDRPAPIVDAVRAAIRDVNPDLVIFNIRTLDDVIAESLSPFTLYLRLIAGFAALALLLAATGTYGVMSYLATAGTREFAIRLAIGADQRGLLRLVLGRSARLTAIGLLAGLAATVFATPLLRNLPVTVRPPDLFTAGSAAVIIAVVSLGASLMPARRAAATDLAATLRKD